ncbi:MAG: helix-turn-helix domain-containing protein [Clostridiales bacterium]|nr:helix-turn-helix domain-containing protein [Clostridiales bacterium]
MITHKEFVSALNNAENKYYHINKTQFIDLLPIDIGYNKHTTWDISDTYPYYLIHYFIKGNATLIVNGQTYKVTKNQMFLVPPNVPVRYFNSGKGDVEFIWLNFSGIQCMDAVNLTAFANSPVINVTHKKEIFSILAQSLLDCESTLMQTISPLTTLYSILKILIQENSKNVIQPKKSTISDFQTILSFINAHLFSSQLSAQYVCNKCFISPEYLSRIFIKKMKMHYSSYVNIERIKKASSLLEDTDMSVKEIALQTGYKDVFYFCKVFKKYRLFTPSEYRLQKSQKNT